VVIARDLYQSLTRDTVATEASLWLERGADPAAAVAAIRARLPDRDSVELRSTSEVRELSLRIFDRAFAVTYVLEAIAVIIGLLGVSFAASSTTLARRGEFGMLRHIGLLRRQVRLMLAGEGLAMSLVGVLYGLGVGVCLSLVLVYVVNRQSFGWSVDLAIPWWQIAGFSLALMAASAATATLSGRAAMSVDALRAVREDW
jgi:putative ABC transport system permease protein